MQVLRFLYYWYKGTNTNAASCAAGKACVPIQCGCGSASCEKFGWNIDALALSWVPAAVSVPHNATVIVSCSEGHRASSDRFSTCTTNAPIYSVVCNDCVYSSERRCRPVSCGRYEDWQWPAFDSTRIGSVVYAEPFATGDATGAATAPVLTGDTWNVRYLTTATVTCKEGYRARLGGSQRQAQPSDPTSFTVTCSENCAYLPSYSCSELACGLYTPQDGVIISPAQPFYFKHGDLMKVKCDRGYKVAGTSLANCSQELRVECYLGTFIPDIPKSYTVEQAFCVPIDCYNGDACSLGSGGRCSISNISRSDAFAERPGVLTIQSQKILTIQCKEGASAVPTGAEFSSCADASSYTHACQDCVWNLGAFVCRPRQCVLIDITNVANTFLIPQYQLQNGRPRLHYAQSLTLQCLAGSRAAEVGAQLVDKDAPSSFNVTCAKDCQYIGMKKCITLSCGKFYRQFGMKLDAQWSLDKVYTNGERISVGCLGSYAVGPTGTLDILPSCIKEFTMECWEGGFRAVEPFLPIHPQCNPVFCPIGKDDKKTCGEGLCPAYSSAIRDSISNVKALTPNGIVSADDVNVVSGSTVIVSCMPSMSANDLSLFPQSYSDCPVIPSQGGVGSFKSGEYPAYCQDCDWVRRFYCATSRCPSSLLPSLPNILLSPTPTFNEYFSFGEHVPATCARGFTFDTSAAFKGNIARSNLTEPLTFKIQCRQNCTFSQPPACVPKSCEKFTPPRGTMVVPKGQSAFSSDGKSGYVYVSTTNTANQVYYHGDEFSVVCLASHRVQGTDCTSAYDVVCDDGVLKRRDGGGFEACEAVKCLDASACGVCREYMPLLYGDNNVASWEPRTQVEYGGKVLVSCKEVSLSLLSFSLSLSLSLLSLSLCSLAVILFVL